MSALTLVSNPGSASRKYALFAGHHERAQLHFEHNDQQIVCTLQKGSERKDIAIDIKNLKEAAGLVMPILKESQALNEQEEIDRIALRVVAPSSYFLEDRELNHAAIERLKSLEHRAPLHINATLQELNSLQHEFGKTPIIGISDSAFHRTKSTYAWHYGIPLDDAEELDILRFGYYGISAASAVHTLKHADKLPPKVVLCHIGSGVSVTAIYKGRSLDTTMGYSPLEGPLMATGSGTIDITAVKAIREAHHLDEAAVEKYLNNHSGLLGLGGSSDVRALLEREAADDKRARLALETYIYSIQKAIGQMTAALGGIDMLAFTATVGERSAPIRKHIVEGLEFLDLLLDQKANNHCIEPTELTRISRLAHSKPIFVIPAGEAGEMARIATNLQAG